PRARLRPRGAADRRPDLVRHVVREGAERHRERADRVTGRGPGDRHGAGVRCRRSEARADARSRRGRARGHRPRARPSGSRAAAEHGDGGRPVRRRCPARRAARRRPSSSRAPARRGAARAVQLRRLAGEASMIVDADGTPVTFAVQAVPWEPMRARRAEELRAEIEQQGNPVTIVWDREHSAFETWKRVLDTLAEAPGSGVLVEDDVRFCQGWPGRMQQTIDRRPHDLIRFFNPAPGYPEGERPEDTFWSDTCLRFAPGDAADLRSWVGDRDTQFLRDYFDIAIGHWLRLRRRRYWQHAPSLVQHERWTSAVNPNRRTDRLAVDFEEEGSMGKIDPADTLVVMVTVEGREEMLHKFLRSLARQEPGRPVAVHHQGADPRSTFEVPEGVEIATWMQSPTPMGCHAARVQLLRHVHEQGITPAAFINVDDDVTLTPHTRWDPAIEHALQPGVGFVLTKDRKSVV